jgi:alpha-L-arabinofuranosidase
MKKISTFFLLLTSLAVCSQTTVTIDAGNVLRTLTGRENGINLDYLMDGTYLSPSISTAQSLRNVNAKLLRYPGGEKSDNYLFSAAPYTSSSPRVALLDTCFWPSNDKKFVDTLSPVRLCHPEVLDFDEYITMCNTVGASPLVVVAYDAAYNTRSCNGKPTKQQLLTNAVEWVKYANIKKGYDVKYWMIGNESWNDAGYNGKVTPSKYADDLEDFATAMKAVDPSIKIIANGKSGWWQTILQSSAASKIDFLGLSEYPVFNYSGGYNYYRQNDVNLTAEVDLAINDIETYAPSAHKSRIKVIATEYNSIDWGNDWASVNNLGHALANFQLFGDLVVKPKLEAACMWNTRWVQNNSVHQSLYDAFDNDGNLNANGTSMKVWGSSLLNAMVSAESSSQFVRTYASYDGENKKLNIFLINKDNSPRQANVTLNNYEQDFNGSVWQLRGSSASDKFPDYELTDSVYEATDISTVMLPANSVTVLKLQKDDVALPVKLVAFEARKVDTGITLSWETLEEKDITEYIIERSSDGSLFTAIASILAKNGDSSQYGYVDTKIENAGTLHYRLMVVNAKGEKVSSRVVSVTVNALPQAFMAGPNPFDDRLQIKLRSEENKKIYISLIDLLGRTVYQQSSSLFRGNNTVELTNLNKLMKGMYMLKVGDDNGSSAVKLIKK